MRKKNVETPKHDHTLTDLLKVIIFAVLMLTPFLDIMSRCLYVVCNKNAKESYYGQTINEEQRIYVENGETIHINTTYYMNTSELNYPLDLASDNNLYVENFKVVDRVNLTDSQYNSLDENVIYRIVFTYYNTYRQLTFYKIENNVATWLIAINIENYNMVCSFNITQAQANVPLTTFYKIEYNKYSYLDNVLQYAVYEVNNSNMYTWVRQTATYNTINQMFNGLTIQDNIMPLLLTYWFMLIVIYVIVDIIIKIFTYITHLIK